MHITKNGFYKLSDISDSEIQVEDNLVVAFYDNGDISKKIYLGKNSNVEVFGFLENQEDYKIEFYQNDEKSKLQVRYLLNSNNSNLVKSKIYSKINSNYSESDIKILSVAGEDGNIDLDGIIEISKGIKQVKGHLIEENLFLGEKGKIKGIPTLLVRSDDVEASHACKIEKISEEELFYLRSRGIKKQDSLNMILEAKIKTIYSCLGMIDKDFYNELIDEVLKKING